MKDFFRERSYDAAKLLVTQIAISAFGFVLTFAAGSVDNDSLRTGCSVFAVMQLTPKSPALFTSAS